MQDCKNKRSGVEMWADETQLVELLVHSEWAPRQDGMAGGHGRGETIPGRVGRRL